MRHLKIDKGKYTDVSNTPYKLFNGVVPRDLDQADTYDDGETVNKVISKKVDGSGRIVIAALEV